MRSGRNLTTILVIAVVLLHAGPTPLGAGEASEAHIKAAIVYKVTKFVTWPGDSLATTGPCTLGIVGEGEVQAALRGLENRLVAGRPLAIVDVSDPDALERCHIVYFGSGSEAVADSMVEALANAPILTVSDTEGFAEGGGMLELVRQRNRIGFAINKAAVDRSGVRFGSQLLKMAHIVGED